MPKRGREKEVEDYQSDGGFVENDDDEAPKNKKNKKPTVAPNSKGASESNFWEVISDMQSGNLSTIVLTIKSYHLDVRHGESRLQTSRRLS
jgi:hypothetical protein